MESPDPDVESPDPGIESPDPGEVASPSPSARSPRLILGLIAVVLFAFILLAAGGCGAYFYFWRPEQLTSWKIPLLSKPLALNQIAFIGNDENLWLVSPDGTGLRSLTTDGRGYRFPTWAPDGHYLAFIGPGTGATALFVSPLDQSEPKVVYSQPGSPPFYLYWAPNSHDISFLTQEKAGLALRLVDAQIPDTQRIMEEG